MKKAISRILWVDVTDGHEYHAGEEFPHDGRKIQDSRMKSLASEDNQIGFPVIDVTEVEEPKTK